MVNTPLRTEAAPARPATASPRGEAAQRVVEAQRERASNPTILAPLSTPAVDTQALVQPKCAGTCGCEPCVAKSVAETFGVQKKDAPDGRFRGMAALPTAGGHLLPPGDRAELGASFGTDFSSVRIHPGHPSAEAMGARALTVGNHIAFAPGEYQPETGAGRHLLAHELAHVVQQSGGPSVAQGKGAAGPGHEAEADRAAEAVGRGEKVGGLTGVDKAGVQKAGGVWNTVTSLGSAAGSALIGDWAGAIQALRAVPGLSGLVDFLDDPMAYLKERLLPKLKAWASDLLGTDVGALFDHVKEAMVNLAVLMSEGFADNPRACAAAAAAADHIRSAVQAILDSGLAKKFGGAVNKITSFVDTLYNKFIKAEIEVVLKAGGAAWDLIKSIGSTVAGWFQKAKALAGKAVEWAKKKLGISDEGEGVVDWLKRKAGEIWAPIKEKLKPLETPLKVIGTILLVTNPVGQLYLLFTYGPQVIDAIKWLWAHRGERDLIGAARREHGPGSPITKVLEGLQNLGVKIGQVREEIVSGLGKIAENILKLAGEATGLPLLDWVGSAIRSLGNAIQATVDKAMKAFSSFATKARQIAGQVYAKLKPLIDIVISLAMAITNPQLIPVILAGWAWRLLPDCYKGIIIDLILDFVIGFLDRMPASPAFGGVLWMLLKPPMLGFLRQVRALPTEVKVTISNKIAQFVTGGSIGFLGGLIKGYGIGLLEGILSPITDILALGEGLLKLGNWLLSLVIGGLGLTGLVPGAPSPPSGARTTTAPSTPPPPATTPNTGPAAAPTSASPEIAQEDRPDASGVIAITSVEQLQRISARENPAAAGPGEPAPAQGEFVQEARQLGSDVKPSIDTIFRDGAAAFKEYFTSQQGGSIDTLMSKLGTAWGQVKEAISAQGAKLARDAAAIFFEEGSDAKIGEKVGWLVGFISGNVLLIVISMGVAGAVQGARAAVSPLLKGLDLLLNWTDKVFGLFMRGLKAAGRAIVAAAKKLGELATKAGGALKKVMDALRKVGDAFVGFVERLLGKARKPKVDLPSGQGVPGAPGHGSTPGSGPPRPQTETLKGTSNQPHTRRSDSVRKSGQLEGEHITPQQARNELDHGLETRGARGEPPNRRVDVEGGAHEYHESSIEGCPLGSVAAWVRNSRSKKKVCQGGGVEPPRVEPPRVDPGGRGNYHLDDSLIAKSKNADRLRELQSRVPKTESELAELVRLRREAAGADLPEVPGTPEHMLASWNDYKRSGRDWPFDRWANGHPSRLANSAKGPAIEASYKSAFQEAGALPEGRVLRSSSGQRRQVDLYLELADGQKHMIQIKSGPESLTTVARQSGGAKRGTTSLSNKEALAVDADFVQNGTPVTWVFEKPPSGPLVAEAHRSGVNVVIGVTDDAARLRMVTLLKKQGMTDTQISSIRFVSGPTSDLPTTVAKMFAGG